MSLKKHKDEDLKKPENRTNLALFAILMIPEIHSFICGEFRIPSYSIVSPYTNLTIEDFTTTMRPDFRIASGNTSKEQG